MRGSEGLIAGYEPFSEEGVPCLSVVCRRWFVVFTICLSASKSTLPGDWHKLLYPVLEKEKKMLQMMMYYDDV
jgi:hypothetical protein